MSIPDELTAVAVFLRRGTGWQPIFVVGMDSCDECRLGVPVIFTARGGRFVHVDVTRCGQRTHDHMLFAIGAAEATRVWSPVSSSGAAFDHEGTRYAVVTRGAIPIRVVAGAASAAPRSQAQPRPHRSR